MVVFWDPSRSRFTTLSTGNMAVITEGMDPGQIKAKIRKVVAALPAADQLAAANHAAYLSGIGFRAVDGMGGWRWKRICRAQSRNRSASFM